MTDDVNRTDAQHGDIFTTQLGNPDQPLITPELTRGLVAVLKYLKEHDIQALELVRAAASRSQELGQHLTSLSNAIERKDGFSIMQIGYAIAAIQTRIDTARVAAEQNETLGHLPVDLDQILQQWFKIESVLHERLLVELRKLATSTRAHMAPVL